MKKLLLYIIMMLVFGIQNASAQTVQREGNTFVQVSKQKSSVKETKTQFTYQDSKGNVYPVYLSSTGKAFIKRVSKKTGKEYPQYLPDVGKQINPEAYKETEKTNIKKPKT